MCCRCGRQAFKYWGELEQLQKRYSQFAKNDLYLMLEWFHAHSIDGTMTQADFLEAMGFTSRAGYLFQRMFNVMDQDGNGQISVDEYLTYINTISFGSEDDKIGLGFEMFNTSGKKSMTYDDFYKSYETLILNWSLLLGEKLQISPEAVHSIFQQLDCRSKGTIEKQDYVNALKENPYLLNWFNFFSDLHEHLKNKTKGPFVPGEQFNVELILIKMVKSFREIGSKVDQVLSLIDANSSYEEWQHRKSLHMSPVADSKSSGIFLSPVAAQSKEQSTAEFIRKRSFPQHPRPSPFGLVEKHHFKPATETKQKLNDIPEASAYEELKRSSFNASVLGKEPAKDVRRSALEIVIDNHEDQSPPASHHNNASGPEPTTKPPEPVRHEQVRIEFAEECKPISEHDSVINSSEEGIGELHNKTMPIKFTLSPDEHYRFMTETKKQYEKPMQPLGLNGGLRGAKQQVDAVGQLLRSNPLARAVWSMFGRPGMGMKASFENQHPLPIKEPPDEDVIDDQARVTSPIAVSKLVHTEGSIVLSKPARRSRGNSLDSTTERRKRIVELLREVVEITTEQSEYISREMNDAKDKYRLATQHRHRENEKEKLLTEQRSNVTMNVPKIPFTKNKVLKNMQAGGGNLVMYAHDNFALVANMMIGIKKAVDSVMEYPDVRPEDFLIVSKFYIVPWAVLNDRENTTKFRNCKFIDYAPQVFYNIRRIFRIRTQDYTRALGPQQLLVLSPFCRTRDRLHIVGTSQDSPSWQAQARAAPSSITHTTRSTS